MLKRRLCVFLIAVALVISSSMFGLYPNTVHASTGDGSPGDTNITYVGRWDKSNPSLYNSYWGGAYFKVNFTGTTVKVNLGGAVNMFVNIDNTGEVLYTGASGIVNLTPTPLASGTHSLRVTAKYIGQELKFQGLILDAGASTQAATSNNGIIEFIGDSITTGQATTNGNINAYAWLVGEQLGFDHTQISFGGIPLADGYGNLSGTTNNHGMSAQYYKLKSLDYDYATTPDWDFTVYTPQKVVINLGQNDGSLLVPLDVFQSTYITFLQNIRTRFPNAEIYVMRTFSGNYASETQAAVASRNAGGDSKVYFIDTTGWISYGDTVDGVHPSDSGHIKIANLLSPILAASNLATDASVSATSSVEGYGWGMATVNDGWRSTTGTSNGWTSNNSLTVNHTESVTLDMGSSQTVGKVNLYPRNDTGNIEQNFPVDFTIKTSTDAITWTTNVTQAGYAQPGNVVQSFSFPAVTARYVKVEGTSLRPNPSDANNYRMAFAEEEIYCTPDQNYATGASISATSSVEGYGWGMAKVNDGERNTTGTSNGWTSDSSLTANHTESVTLDMGSSKTIGKVDMYPRNDGADTGQNFPIDFTIKTSADGTTWTTNVTQVGYAQPGNAVQRFIFSPVAARYVKVEGTSLRPNPNDANNYRMAFAEIEIYSTPDPNYATGAGVSATSSVEGYGWGMAMVNDGERNTTGISNGWTSDSSLTANHTESVTLDMGSSKAIDRVDLYPRNDAGNIGQNFPIDFTIKTSLDGTTWTTGVTQVGFTQPGNAVQSFNFSTVAARYVKVEGTNLRPNPNDANNYRMAFAEVEIH